MKKSTLFFVTDSHGESHAIRTDSDPEMTSGEVRFFLDGTLVAIFFAPIAIVSEHAITDS